MNIWHSKIESAPRLVQLIARKIWQVNVKFVADILFAFDKQCC